ncbi:MAG TPA: indole-3-glycerol phosphate synthase TrpC [Actinocrinis sp.]|nr:indole-3-glycerol phosphate synthase TrpC [Actinocrinis sp.]
MSTVFDQALAVARADLARRQALVPLAQVKERALAQASALDGVGALCGDGVAVIAEVDPLCPAKGELAGEYEQAGANVISVPISRHLSDPVLHDLRDVRGRVQVPVLCKDLVVSSYQLWEARAHGADLALLMVAALGREALVSLIERAESIGLTALVEVHDERELSRAVAAGARIIAVNPRDPLTREADQAALARLLPLIPAGIVRVAECGPAGRSDLIACAKAGADAVLTGQTLLSTTNPRETVARLVAVGTHPALGRRRRQTT